MKVQQLMAAGLILVAGTSIAQTLKGKVTDSQGQPQPFIATGLIHLPDSAITKGTVTDENGNYTIDQIPPGAYVLRIELPGYLISVSEPLSLQTSDTIELPPLVLRPSGVRLDEITVSTIKKTVEFKNGNVTVNVENSPLASGNTVYDLLTRLPGVMLDPINNSISIQGREGVKFYIDGRLEQLSGPQLINLLRSMSASSIEKIEVLKNPPIRYDASGTAGIINIVTKKSKLYGFSGQINTGVSLGFYPRSESGFSFNYKTKRFNLFLNGSTGVGKFISVNNFNREINREGQMDRLDQKHTEIEDNVEMDFNIGADWYVNKKTTIGFKVTPDPGKDAVKINGNALLTDSTTGYDRLDYDMNSKESWSYINYNVNAEHRLDTNGGKILLSLDYSPNREGVNSYFNNRFSTAGRESLAAKRYWVKDNHRITFYSAKLDVEKQVREGIKLSAGAKINRQEVARDYLFHWRNSSGDYARDSSFSNLFNFQQQENSAYLQVDQEVGDIEISAGLRAEQTVVSASEDAKKFRIDRNFLNLFPLFSAEYEASEKHNFQFSYNRRINRPESFSYFPFSYFWVNSLSSSTGNPSLRPEYSNTFEFTHVYSGKLSNSIAYSRLSDYIMGYTLQNDSTNAILENVANIKSSTTLGYSLFFELALKKWWNLTGNVNVFYNSYAGVLDGVNYTASGYGYAATFNTSFILPRRFRAEAEFDYVGPKPMGIFTIQPRWALNLAVKRSFLKSEQLTFTLGATDIFYTMVGRNRVQYGNQNWKISETNDSRRIYFSLSWNFGRIKTEEEEERQSGNNEELRDKLKH